MKIALSQINYRVGDISYNQSRIIDAIGQAKTMGADLVVFSELSVCGYPPADLLNMKGFTDRCLEAVDHIASHCIGIGAIIGTPVFNPGLAGKRLHNAAFLLENGKPARVYHKGLLPTYDVFDEYRYFEPSGSFHTITFKDRKIALTICEDIWNIDTPRLYHVNPMDELIKQSPDMMINISASPFSWNRGPERMHILFENAKTYQLPLFYVNQQGANTDLIFDGGSAVVSKEGKLLAQLPFFKEDLQVFDTDSLPSVMTNHQEPAPVHGDRKFALLLEALILGIRDYFGKTGQKKALVGLSGGIDSALTLVLATMALGAENLWAVLLPGPYSSGHSVSDAMALTGKLGVKADQISINDINQSLTRALQPYFAGIPAGIAEENLQARARAIVLMGLSNKHGYMLLNTSNKSEAAVGYGTLYGDMCGGLGVIADLYKTEVYALSRYINRDQEIIPVNTINKPPSAELKPNQQDTDSLPEYDQLDPILFQYIEKERNAREIIQMGYAPGLVTRIIDLVNQSEYKRKQSPPALRVSQKGFGTGRRMPIVANYNF